MTSISAAERLLTRVETYLAGVFHPFPEERVIAGNIQSFYGGFFCFCGTQLFAAPYSILQTRAGAGRCKYWPSSAISSSRRIAFRTSIYGC
jgi:hypothetical protein